MTTATTEQLVAALESLRAKGTPTEQEALDALTDRHIRLAHLTDRLLARFDRARDTAASNLRN